MQEEEAKDRKSFLMSRLKWSVPYAKVCAYAELEKEPSAIYY